MRYHEEDSKLRSLDELATAFGRGLLAGLAGTAVMTASQLIEMKINGGEPSTAPADAAEKVLGIEPKDEAAERRFAQLVHWAYGIGWGGVHGVLRAAGLRRPAEASGAHLALVWGSALVMLPALGVAPPPTEWGKEQLGRDFVHHAVFAAATGVAYELLARTREP